MVLVGYIVRLKGNFDLGGFIVDGGSIGIATLKLFYMCYRIKENVLRLLEAEVLHVEKRYKHRMWKGKEEQCKDGHL